MWSGHHIWERTAEDDKEGYFHSNQKNVQTAAYLRHFWMKLLVASAVICCFMTAFLKLFSSGDHFH